MNIKIHTKDNDSVIQSIVLTGTTTYGYAVDSLYPLINRFSSQRKLQNPSFYDRLRKDILNGCLMPAITLALIDETEPDAQNTAQLTEYVNSKMQEGYVLDGMQRLNALNLVKDEPSFDRDKTLFVNVIISKNKDMLLYRMITLNNGQKPMTPRHQIEVLTEELFDFESLDIVVQSEKERAEKIKRGAFNLADIAKGYLAFFTENVHNENNKIISEKMDEIIVGRIMDSAVIESGLEFQSVLELIDLFSKSPNGKEWLMTQNNLIGFCVGIRSSYSYVSTLSEDEFGELCVNFETAFKGINAAKVNLGKYRRELAKKYIEKISEFRNSTALDLLEFFSEETA